MARKHYGKAISKTVIAVLLLIITAIGLAYGSVLSAMDRAAAEYTRGDLQASLTEYQNVEKRLRSLGVLRLLPAGDRRNLFLNQGRLLYALGRYDDAQEQLDRESDFSGATVVDGRFLELKGEMNFRRAIKNYRESPGKDVNLLEESLHTAEDNLREALRLLPNDWEAKYNYEYIDFLRNLLNRQPDGDISLLKNQQSKEVDRTELPPDLAP